MMMAGLDGIEKQIHPGGAIDKDLFDLMPAELMDIPKIATSLEQAVESLQADHEFLLKGDVFSRDFIDSHIALREEDIALVRSLVHPMDFELYYSN